MRTKALVESLKPRLNRPRTLRQETARRLLTRLEGQQKKHMDNLCDLLAYIFINRQDPVFNVLSVEDEKTCKACKENKALRNIDHYKDLKHIALSQGWTEEEFDAHREQIDLHIFSQRLIDEAAPEAAPETDSIDMMIRDSIISTMQHDEQHVKNKHAVTIKALNTMFPGKQ